MSRNNRKGNDQNQQMRNSRTPSTMEDSWNDDNGSEYANGGAYNSDSNDRNRGSYPNDVRESKQNTSGSTRGFDAFGDETADGGYPRRTSSYNNSESNRYDRGPGTYENQGNQGNYGNQRNYGSQGGYGNQGNYSNSGGQSQSNYGNQSGYGNLGGYGNQGGYNARQDRSSRQEWDNEGGYTGNAQTNEMHSGSADANRRYGRQGSYGQSGAYGQSGSYGQSGRYDSEGRTGSNNWGSQSGYDTDLGASPSKRGTAPRSYKRSDERLNEDVCEALMAKGLDCSAVDVEVSGGVVTLSGEVSNRSDRLRMEHIAAEVSGVTDVENKLKIGSSSSGSSKSGSSTSGSYSGSSSTGTSSGGIASAAKTGSMGTSKTNEYATSKGQ